MWITYKDGSVNSEHVSKIYNPEGNSIIYLNLSGGENAVVPIEMGSCQKAEREYLSILNALDDGETIVHDVTY